MINPGFKATYFKEMNTSMKLPRTTEIVVLLGL